MLGDGKLIGQQFSDIFTLIREQNNMSHPTTINTDLNLQIPEIQSNYTDNISSTNIINDDYYDPENMDHDTYNIQRQNFIQDSSLNSYRPSFVQQKPLSEICDIQKFKNDLSHTPNQMQYIANTMHDLQKIQQNVSDQLQALYRFKSEVTALYYNMLPKNQDVKYYQEPVTSRKQEHHRSGHSSHERHNDNRKYETDRTFRKHKREYRDDNSTQKRSRHRSPERKISKYPVRSAFCWITHIPISENKEELSRKIIESFKETLHQIPMIRFIGMSSDYPTTYRIDVDIPLTIEFTNELENKLCTKIHNCAQLKIPKMYYK
jgi:hypothetical protein